MKIALACVAALGVLWANDAFEANPRKVQIFSLYPSGGTPSASVDVEVLGANLDGLTRFEPLCDDIKGDVLASGLLAAKLRLHVRANASPALCPVRVASANGVSNLMVFRIDNLPQVEEHEPNDSPETAMRLNAPIVVNGRLAVDEDVDFFLIRGKAGEQLTADFFAARNGSGLNAEMYLLDPRGRRLAVGDAEEGADPVIRYRFEQDGDYHLAVRGTFGVLNISFPTGHPAYVYQLRISMDAPVLTSTRPFHIAASRSSQIQITGDSLDKVDRVEFSNPAISAVIVERSRDHLLARVDAPAQTVGLHRMWAGSGSITSSPVNFLVTPQPDRVETEPNNNLQEATTQQLDEVISGRIATSGEADVFAFKAPHDRLYVWELQAGEFASLLDPKIELLDSNGKPLASADGSPGALLSISRKLKRDEQVYARITQSVLGYAGPSYNYRLWVREAKPRFAITPGSRQPAPKRLGGSDRIYLPRGEEFAIPLRIEWIEGFEEVASDIAIDVEGLPEGVEATPLIVKPGDGRREKDKSPYIAIKDLLIRAQVGAQHSASRIRIRGKSGALTVYESVRVNASGSYVLSLSGGTPQQIDHRYLNIIDPVRYELRPEIGDERYPTRYVVRPGSSKPLLVTVLTDSRELPKLDFSFANLPSGVRIAKVEPLADQMQYRLTIEASPSAERGWRPMVILAATLAGGQTFTTPYFGMAVQ